MYVLLGLAMVFLHCGVIVVLSGRVPHRCWWLAVGSWVVLQGLVLSSLCSTAGRGVHSLMNKLVSRVDDWFCTCPPLCAGVLWLMPDLFFFSGERVGLDMHIGRAIPLAHAHHVAAAVGFRILSALNLRRLRYPGPAVVHEYCPDRHLSRFVTEDIDDVVI